TSNMDFITSLLLALIFVVIPSSKVNNKYLKRMDSDGHCPHAMLTATSKDMVKVDDDEKKTERLKAEEPETGLYIVIVSQSRCCTITLPPSTVSTSSSPSPQTVAATTTTEVT
ncbi:10340_t:CDS:2, partial [Gigaspora rosea]